MTRSRSFLFLAPVTLGSALVGISLTLRHADQDDEKDNASHALIAPDNTAQDALAPPQASRPATALAAPAHAQRPGQPAPVLLPLQPIQAQSARPETADKAPPPRFSSTLAQSGLNEPQGALAPPPQQFSQIVALASAEPIMPILSEILAAEGLAQPLLALVPDRPDEESSAVAPPTADILAPDILTPLLSPTQISNSGQNEATLVGASRELVAVLEHLHSQPIMPNLVELLAQSGHALPPLALEISAPSSSGQPDASPIASVAPSASLPPRTDQPLEPALQSPTNLAPKAPVATSAALPDLLPQMIAAREAQSALLPTADLPETIFADVPDFAPAQPSTQLAASVATAPRQTGLDRQTPDRLTQNLQRASPNIDLAPGRQIFPMEDGGPGFTYDDELILQIKVHGVNASDTIIAYGTRDAVYLPLGELAMILDLAIRVSDDGHYASGWFLSEDRTVTLDLRQNLLTTPERTVSLGAGIAQALDGEMFVRSQALAAILPMDLKPDLRSQTVLLTTRETFPFEERLRREQDRERLAQRGQRGGQRDSWPREEAPWLALSAPLTDVEMRGVSDSQKGTRGEFDVRLAGDLAWMTAEAYLSASTRDGLTSSLIELGRRDVDGDLLGPLKATEFQIGDVATTPMPMGLRGTSGRGGYVTNRAFESFSVFDDINLRGLLPDGYEVELYRNGVLLGSTAQPINGQYEFLQVPVDYGLNVFRIVFYGPQGQRREEVRRISVGDGRLSPGVLEYSFGAVQNATNLLGVKGPDFRPGSRYGDIQAVGEVAYGFSTDLTAIASAAFYENEGDNRWITTGGIRSGLGRFALRADIAASAGGGYAGGLGLGGPAFGGAFTLSHFEYGGGFVDEVRSFSSEQLRRASELDFNTTVGLGAGLGFASLPLNLRARHIEFANGRRQFNAALRGSARLPGMIVSHTFDYSRTSSAGAGSFSQLAGDFNLATFNASDTQLRAGLGYRILPALEVSLVSADIDHALDDKTVLSSSAAYSFTNKDFTFGLSAIREFDRFTLALDGQYAPGQNIYAATVRLGFSFGRDPLRRALFMDSPGKASSGGVAVRAFHDRDGDLIYGPGDTVLPLVDFSASNDVATTDTLGLARLGQLGSGNPVVVQMDPSSLPDISMAPRNRGIEIVPRPGRIQQLDFPVIELSAIEGNVTFVDGESQRGVSGLRLILRSVRDESEYNVRTERGGYFFYEEVPPGQYNLLIEAEQARRLAICMDPAGQSVLVPAISDVLERDLIVQRCQ